MDGELSEERVQALKRDFGDMGFLLKLVRDSMPEMGYDSRFQTCAYGGTIILANWDIERFLLLSIHLIYANLAVGDYDRDEILLKSLAYASDATRFFHRNLDSHLGRLLNEAFGFTVYRSEKGLSWAAVRDLLERQYRYRFPPGRPKKDTATDRERAGRIYEAVLEILRPGYIRSSHNKYRCIRKALEWCNAEEGAGLTPEDVFQALFDKRKPTTAAVCLVAKALRVSESTVERYLGLK